MNVVVDTNVLISGIFWKGQPRTFIDLIFHKELSFYASPKIVAEYFRIIDKIAKKNVDIAQRWKALILKEIHIIETDITLNLCRDPKDDMFLECAIAAKAQYIVSGDEDLLVLGNVENIDIITVKDFFEKHPELG